LAYGGARVGPTKGKKTIQIGKENGAWHQYKGDAYTRYSGRWTRKKKNHQSGVRGGDNTRQYPEDQRGEPGGSSRGEKGREKTSFHTSPTSDESLRQRARRRKTETKKIQLQNGRGIT